MRAAVITLAIVSLVALVGCRTPDSQDRDTFLATADANWEKWLNEKVSVHRKGMALWQLRDLEAFRDGNYYLDGHTAGGVLVNLEADELPRREILWAIHRQTGLFVELYNYQGVTVIRFRSVRMALLKGD